MQRWENYQAQCRQRSIYTNNPLQDRAVKRYLMEGLRYKIGRFGFVYREAAGYWHRSTVEEEELKENEKNKRRRKKRRWQ